MASYSGNTEGKCGKLLRCGHRCLDKTGTDHACVCSRKWGFDPGCHHLVSGICSEFTNLRLVCVESCGKVLECGHPCSEPCSSGGCICHICFDKHCSVDVKETLIEEKSMDRIKVSPAVMSSWPSFTAAAGPGSSSSYTEAIAGASTRPEPGSSKMTFGKKHLHNNKPYSCKPATSGISSSSRTPPKLTPEEQFPEMVNAIDTALREAFEMQGMSVARSESPLPQHQYDQLQKMMLDSAPGSGKTLEPSDFMKVFKQCVNEHVFPVEQEHCHVCGGRPHGSPMVIVNVSATATAPKIADIAPAMTEMGLNDDNAWKLGLTKCINKHYFKADLRVCNTCGQRSEFVLPNVYPDSDSSDYE